MKIDVEFRGEVIGSIDNAISDMWYYSGEWVSNDSGCAAEFTSLVSSLDGAQVMQDLEQGVIIRYREGGENDFNFGVAVCLIDGDLCFRMMGSGEALEWASKRYMMS